MTRASATFTVLALASLAGSALAADRVPVLNQPVIGPDGSLIYPHGAAIPRFETEVERRWRLNNPGALAGFDAPSPPPTGPIRCVAEYEPMEGLVLSWSGTTAWQNILGQIARRVTVEAQSRVYIGVPNGTVQANATNTLTAAGANLSNVTFFTVPLNSIWVRDYGPRYVYEGDVRIIADHRYNRTTRTLDDNQPVVFGQLKNHQYYEMGINGITLVHGGGNYHLNALGDAYATQLIVNENPALTAAQILQVWNLYQGNTTTLTQAFPTAIDATQHIDMWMQIIGDRQVIIGDWPNNVGSVQDQICDNTAALMQSRGYTVTRVPNYSIGGTHFTFTNMVITNNVVLVPQYNTGPGAAISTQAFNTIQAAFGPSRTAYQINADAIVTAAGVFHCIVMHLPQHKGLPGPNGGLAPTAYLRGPNGNEAFQPGDQFTIRWITDDDAPVSAQGGVAAPGAGVSLLLSTDGGATFPTTIATGLPALGSFNWTIPSGINTADARVRVVARDGVGNTGSDDSDRSFIIGNPNPFCYANCDGSSAAPLLNALDFACFLQRYQAGDGYANCDGSTLVPVLNALDFACFLQQYVAGCP